MNREELRKEAARLNIPGRSKMTKDELEAAVTQAIRDNELMDHAASPNDDFWSEDSRERLAAEQYTTEDAHRESGARSADISDLSGGETDAEDWDRHVRETLPANSPERTPATPRIYQTHTQRKHRKGQPERGLVWDGIAGDVMPTHHNGRAVGAKHWQQVKRIELVPLADWERDLIHLGHQTRRLPNSERVQKYARNNCPHGCGASCMPKLTHRQMRRVRKNANRHGEGFKYRALGRQRVWTQGMSLLARTPEGLGIFYRFAN